MGFDEVNQQSVKSIEGWFLMIVLLACVILVHIRYLMKSGKVISEQKAKLKEQTETIARLTTTEDQQKHTITELEGNITEFQNTVAELKDTITTQKVQITSLDASLTDMTRQLEEQTKKLDEATKTKALEEPVIFTPNKNMQQTKSTPSSVNKSASLFKMMLDGDDNARPSRSTPGSESKKKKSLGASATEQIEKFFPVAKVARTKPPPPRHVVAFGRPIKAMQDHVLNEMFKTEASYLETLELLKTEYHDELEKKGVDAKDLDAVFPNLKALIMIHTGILSKFRNILEAKTPSTENDSSTTNSNDNTVNNNPSNDDNTNSVVSNVTAVSRVLSEHSKELQFYSIFVKSVEDKRSTRHKWSTRDDLADVFRSAENDPRANRRDLESLIIMPVQRILKYSLFFGELLKCAASDEEAEEIRKASNSLKSVSSKINESQRQSDARKALQQWAQDLKKHNELLSETRYVIEAFKCAAAYKGTDIPQNSKVTPSRLVVCNDMLFVATGNALVDTLHTYAQRVTAKRIDSEIRTYVIQNEVTAENESQQQGFVIVDPTHPNLLVSSLREVGVKVVDDEFPESQ